MFRSSLISFGHSLGQETTSGGVKWVWCSKWGLGGIIIVILRRLPAGGPSGWGQKWVQCLLVQEPGAAAEKEQLGSCTAGEASTWPTSAGLGSPSLLCLLHWLLVLGDSAWVSALPEHAGLLLSPHFFSACNITFVRLWTQWGWILYPPKRFIFMPGTRPGVERVPQMIVKWTARDGLI